MDVWEAWLTLVFFFILVGLAYGADRIKACYEDKKRTNKEVEEKDREDEMKIKKSHLRNLAKEHGETVILAVAQGISSSHSTIADSEAKEIRSLFKEILGVENLSNCEMPQLLTVLQPDTLLERFAAKKANNISHAKDFLSLKGQKG